MDRKLKKGIMVVFAANMINMFFSLATNFLLPKYLSIESYAAIKTFQLYVSYVGLFHLGYVDGIYLKYGGQELKSSIDQNFSTSLSTIRVFQCVITGIMLCVSIVGRDWILCLFALSIFPQNVSNYFRFLYQATGEFSIYGKFMNLSTALMFLVNIILLFIVRSDKYILYVGLYVIIYYAIWIVLEIQFISNNKAKKGIIFSWQELYTNIKEGILLTLGNLASMMLTSMDRWFVKFLLPIMDFAQYSFAVSVENFLNLAITPITTTLYNFFCREKDIEKYKEVHQEAIVFSTILPAAAFPVKFILESYLDKYLNSVKIIFLLFAAQIFNIIIRSVYVNLYKVQRMQKRYFAKLIIILIIGFFANIICFKILNSKEAFALGTLFSGIIWFFISNIDFQYLKLSAKEYIYIFGEMGIFLILGFGFESLVGCLIYILFTVLLTIVLMKPVAIKIKMCIENIIKNMKND